MKRSLQDMLARRTCGWLALSLLLGVASARAEEAPAPDEAPAATDSAAVVAAPAADTLAAAAAEPVDSLGLSPAQAADTAAAATGVVRGWTGAPGAPRPQGTRMVQLSEKSHNVVRTGPGDGFSVLGVFSKGREFPVIAKNGDWYGIRISEYESGWIHASLCEEFDDFSDLEFKPNPKLYSRTGSYVLGGYTGGYAFDRKSNSLVVGGRVGYYLFDMLQAEAGVAWTHVNRPAEIVESLFGLTLEAEDFHMLFYNMNLLWEVLPGRQMVPFLTAGVGSSIMLGRAETTFNFGAGTVLFLSKRTSMRWEVRDYRFDSGPEDARVSNDNIEFTLGTSYLF